MRSHEFLTFAILPILALSACVSGCSAPQTQTTPSADFVLVYLRSGPTSGQGDKEQRTKMFQGHMANINRLAKEGSLLIAGPFDKPTDTSLRGILLLDVDTVEKAKALAGTDPGVQAGEFVADTHRIRASPVLRQTGENERRMLAEQSNAPPPDPTKPPQNIRPYVMITARDYAKASSAVAASPFADRVVWGCRFADRPGGVLVLDAEKPQDVRSTVGLDQSSADTIDGWWSTKSLTRLPKPQ